MTIRLSDALMKTGRLAFVACVATIFAWGCTSPIQKGPGWVAISNWEPWTNRIETASELTAALEARWSVGAIRSFCQLTPPTQSGTQNLVTMGNEWRGSLHGGKISGIDCVWWYADTQDGRFVNYSVNAAKGGKYWVVEIGNEQTLTNAPLVPNGDRSSGLR
jgi:hypothetical protein